MKIVIDDGKIKRYRKIGQYTSLAALAILLGGFILAITQIIKTFQSTQEAPIVDERMLTYSYVAMFLGLVLTQISLYFGNRWGRKETIDQTITNNLKGLDDRYILYHYVAPVPHLLVGPSGIWAIAPMYQAGSITYEKNRYRQSGVRLFSRLFGQEGIGRPDMEAEGYKQDLLRYIQKNLPDTDVIEPEVAIVFTNPKAVLDLNEPPYPTMPVGKLKDFIRRQAKEKMAAPSLVQPLIDLLPRAN